MNTLRTALVYLLALSPAIAQIDNSTLTGLISDPSNAVVAGAKVTVRSQATNVGRTTESDSAGYYYFAALAAGQYEISVTREGFQHIAQQITIETAQKARQDFNLTVGRIENTITVEAAAPQLSSEDASVGTVVDNTYVSRFPLFLRSWDDLVNLVAGVQGSRYTEQSGATSAGRTGGFMFTASARFRTTSFLTVWITTPFPKTFRN